MNWFRSKQRGNNSPHPEQRQALFAAAPLLEVGDLIPDDPDTPQSRFHAALASVAVGNRDRAKAQLRELLHMGEAGTRLMLQAWSCLREFGEVPPAAIAREVQGIVVDTGLPTSISTVAAYADRTATVLLADGELVHWSEPDGAIDESIAALLTHARALVADGRPSGPCDQPPADGHALISVLTFGGTHARIGSLEALQQDPACNAAMDQAEQLCKALTARRATAHGES